MGAQSLSIQPERTACPSAYREVKIGRTLYQVTSVFKGEFHLKDALEELAVRRALRAATDIKN